jgi:hypothetical protein
MNLAKATLAVILLLSLPLVLMASPAKEKKSPKTETYALLMGSCFNENGLSLPGAAVLVKIKADPEQKLAKQKWTAVSSPRGEFALRLPQGPITFIVAVTKEGFKPQEKEVSFDQDERQDVVFNLEPLERAK